MKIIDAHDGKIKKIADFGSRVWSCSFDTTIRIWSTKVGAVGTE